MDEMIYGIEAVAKHFQVSSRTIYKWIGKGFPHRNKKEFSRRACELWHYQQKEAGALAESAGPSPAGGEPAADLRAHWSKREIQARAELKEMEVARMRAELIPVKEVETRTVYKILACKNRLLSFSRSLPPLLVGKNEREISAIVDEQVRQLLLAFSRKDSFMADPVDRSRIHHDIDEILDLWEASDLEPPSGENEARPTIEN
jgi:transposase